MIAAAFIATRWAGIGLVVGYHKARASEGPADSLTGAAQWAAFWPILWAQEAPFQ